MLLHFSFQSRARSKEGPFRDMRWYEMPGIWSGEAVEALDSGASAEEAGGLELCFWDWAMCSDLSNAVRWKANGRFGPTTWSGGRRCA